MKRLSFLMTLTVFLASGFAFGQETIYAQEVESYFYADGQMKRSAGQFEITVFV